MKVKEICTWDPWVCPIEGSLADAAQIMWDGDCGSVPIIDAERKVVGIISDRDITMAALTKDRVPRSVGVREVMTGDVVTCHPEDDVRLALRTMGERRVRRLPVIDEQGRLQGILSISDCIRHAKPMFEVGEPGIPSDELLVALQALSTPWKTFFGKGVSRVVAS
jgi:CBS domain-containing protein